MRATKYFKAKDLLDLESALFTDNHNFKYCLIQESQKYFYIGESVHVANVFQRIRSVLMNNQLDLVAHNLQKTVRSTNLADWVIAVFKNPELDDSYIIKQLEGFTQLHKAKRYEVHGKENIKVFLVEHNRYRVQTYLSSAIDLTEGQFNSRAKRLMRLRSARFKDTILGANQQQQYLAVVNAALHSGTGDWIVTEVEVKPEVVGDISQWVRSRNEAFNDLFHREYLTK